jgi:hypothetical protein
VAASRSAHRRTSVLPCCVRLWLLAMGRSRSIGFLLVVWLELRRYLRRATHQGLRSPPKTSSPRWATRRDDSEVDDVACVVGKRPCLDTDLSGWGTIEVPAVEVKGGPVPRG